MANDDESSQGKESVRPAHLWKPGQSGNPGGKRKKLKAIEDMLDEHHRSVENMQVVFNRLKALALGELIEVTNKDGEVIRVTLSAAPEFMKLYLERVLGPVKALLDDDDLADAPPEVLAWLSRSN